MGIWINAFRSISVKSPCNAFLFCGKRRKIHALSLSLSQVGRDEPHLQGIAPAVRKVKTISRDFDRTTNGLSSYQSTLFRTALLLIVQELFSLSHITSKYEKLRGRLTLGIELVFWQLALKKKKQRYPWRDK